AGGGYAEYAAVPAGQVVHLPGGIDLTTAAGLIEVAATVVSNLTHVALLPGETFLVHGGTGGIGSFAIQYAKTLGCKVITTAGSAEKLKICLSLGADLALDYHDDWLAALLEHTKRRGVDVILDVIGAKYLQANVSALALGGRLVIIGMQGGTKGTLDINRLLNKRALVTATSLRFRPVAQKAEICSTVERQIWPLYGNGQIKAPPTTQFELTEVAAAHRLLDSGDNVGKIVLTL
ncbi:MAG: zinc-binding dehydrogenase, partial [Propionibacteriaceae bacterium]|nr:zinc-binding dehydrogenase [Propionibacteriaceae bacterium]